MKKILFLSCLILNTLYCFAQTTEYDNMLKGMYKYTVPLVKTEELKGWITNEKLYILDAREGNEFKVSHIKNAIKVGYDNFKLSSVTEIPKDAKIIVYCSVGYRSERIGEKLIKEGYVNVFNLYGGIFDWVNKGNAVYNANGKVDRVHAYNKDWSKWIKNNGCTKIY